MLAGDEQDEQAEKNSREGVEKESENDRQPVAGLHEAEERHVLADEQARERSDRDPDGPEGGQNFTQVVSQALMPFRSFSKMYSVRPWASTRIEPSVVFLSARSAPFGAGFFAVVPP